MGHPLIEGLEEQVRRAQEGDERALAFLIEATQERLYRFFLYLSANPQLSADLTQDTFIKVLENLHTLREPAGFVSWLLKTGKNLFLDHVRSPRSQEHAELESAPESELAVSRDLDLVVRIHRALERLEPEDRLVLLLVDLEEHSYAEAAKILGISENAVRSRLHRARQAFENEFEAA